MSIHHTHAIIHTDSGMLIGLGSSERSAWTDARREMRKAGCALDESAHECRVASPGQHWRAEIAGGITVVMEAAPAHRPRRDPSAARVNLIVRVHPDTRKLLAEISSNSKESQGQVIDRLVRAAVPTANSHTDP